jgi:succinyl-diaminopimelate desuccinylase
MTHTPVDPVVLTQELIRCPSVTPADAGALTILQTMLADAGFAVTRIERGGIDNLFARWGSADDGPTFGFNGHTDVVPVGDETDWTHPPFSAMIDGDTLYGRGATDMKSGVAAFVAAAVDFVMQTPPRGSVVVTVTGDEEGDATDGTTAILDWMEANGERMDVCLVGEPTCPSEMGEMIKIGRRGSMTAFFEVTGVQGHSAYLHRARNPITPLVGMLDRLAQHELDQGTQFFDPSTLAITTVDVGNPANNVIPAKASATINIRFNDAHKSSDLINWINAEVARAIGNTGIEIDVSYKVSGESFITPAGPFSQMIADVVETHTGRRPELSTSGGTSDARFIRAHCPVVECGLVGKTMHQVDERVPVAQIHTLKAIYGALLERYFAKSERG